MSSLSSYVKLSSTRYHVVFLVLFLVLHFAKFICIYFVVIKKKASSSCSFFIFSFFFMALDLENQWAIPGLVVINKICWLHSAGRARI